MVAQLLLFECVCWHGFSVHTPELDLENETLFFFFLLLHLASWQQVAEQLSEDRINVRAAAQQLQVRCSWAGAQWARQILSLLQTK